MEQPSQFTRPIRDGDSSVSVGTQNKVCFVVQSGVEPRKRPVPSCQVCLYSLAALISVLGLFGDLVHVCIPGSYLYTQCLVALVHVSQRAMRYMYLARPLGEIPLLIIPTRDLGIPSYPISLWRL
eukprot:COSAG05_NODE_7124_length_853_cov_1.259947_1_plen_125_part_00